jgi:hypothetical protein
MLNADTPAFGICHFDISDRQRLRYPHLERVAGKEDVLTQIAAPRVK